MAPNNNYLWNLNNTCRHNFLHLILRGCILSICLSALSFGSVCLPVCIFCFLFFYYYLFNEVITELINAIYVSVRKRKTYWSKGNIALKTSSVCTIWLSNVSFSSYIRIWSNTFSEWTINRVED